MSIKDIKYILSIIILAGFASTSVYAQSGSGDGQDVARLKKRITELEAQIVNMQVMIGTLESLVKQQRAGGGGQFTTSSAVGGGASSGRIDLLEAQLRSLSARIEQINEAVQQGGGAGKRSGKATGFEATTVVGQNNAASRSGHQFQNRRVASLQSSDTPSESGEASSDFKSARSLLFRRDYKAAEKAFRSFIKKHSETPFAGKAQYWLGEIHFQQRNYKKAADNFLRGYSKYKSGQRAPDSLLKLALSLQRLGKKSAACRTFSQLRSVFPNAPDKLMTRALQEESRLRC